MRQLTDPFPYQLEGVQRLEANGCRGLLADDMGLGKSYQALLLCYRNQDLLPAVITCPASVKYNWEHEAKAHFGLRAAVLEGQRPRPLRDLSGNPRLIIINHDILHFWVEAIKDLAPQLIVVDESQAFMSRTSRRTKALQAVAGTVPSLVGLSGTPLLNAPAELFPILNLLWPEQFPGFTVYAQRYCQPRYEYGKWNYKGAARLPELHKRLKSLGMVRRLKSEVQQQLPGQVVRVRPVEMDDPSEYNFAANDFRGWMKDNGKTYKSARTEAMVRCGELLRLAARLKLRQVVAWVNKMLEETDEKIILFGYHTKCLHALQRRCNAESVLIDGSVTGRKRHAAVNKFKLDPRCRVAVCQLQAAGVGCNGLQVGSIVGFCELWWRPGDFQQAAARADRIGQKETVWVNYFVAHGTIEEKLCSILQRKQGNISAVLDGKGKGAELAVFDMLMAEMQAQTAA